MNQLDAAFTLNSEGRFIEALAALNDPDVDPRTTGTRSLKAELLERTGRFGQSRAAVEQLRKSKGVTAKEQSSCEFVLGKIDWEEGATESALAHLQRAVSLASDAGDLRRKCWPNMSLLLAVSDSSGPNAAAPILSELRSDALRLGDPQVLVALHAAVAKTEAKRGLFDTAKTHLRLGQSLLLTTPNLWLEALVESTRATVALLTFDFDTARVYAERALEFAQRSGSAATQRTCLGNLAFLSVSRPDNLNERWITSSEPSRHCLLLVRITTACLKHWHGYDLYKDGPRSPKRCWTSWKIQSRHQRTGFATRIATLCSLEPIYERERAFLERP